MLVENGGAAAAVGSFSVLVLWFPLDLRQVIVVGLLILILARHGFLFSGYCRKWNVWVDCLISLPSLCRALPFIIVRVSVTCVFSLRLVFLFRLA